ncbi:DNA-binding protein [Flavobacterium sp. F372]|uniref:DNA-binding protein n=1 Tax=Flavobacterium bernardetii TaxID=2813823 RepID=A0ABR7J284_9FLAO|nr:DNA-binding protein [Flavobacterium bernardetii]MBC5836196.1 DNA-binding protein [Flavobacterium bernardetii]NHF71422.1 DNA-binding protein [Flavobacterium bernardetii]
MEIPRKQPCRKKEYQKVSFELKLSIIDQINNGLISANFASKKYNISRGTIAYWREKLSNYKSHNKNMSKDEEIRRLKAKIEDLEGVKELQQDIIVEFEKVTGQELSKKLLPESLALEIAKKKKKLSK